MDNRPSLDDNAFSQLYKAYFTTIAQFVAGYVKDEEAAKDIAQDVFLILLNNRQKIDTSYPVKAYLVTLARNRALDYLKHRQVQEINQREIAEWTKNTPEDWKTIEERENRLREKMQQLTEKQRTAITKCVVDGKTYQEAAEEMGISVNSLKTHLARGLAFLRAEMTTEEDDGSRSEVLALLVLLRKQ